MRTCMAPSTCEFCTEPELLKVQEIFSTMSTKISSRTLPSVLEVSRMDLMTPVGPLPTPENSELAAPLCTSSSPSLHQSKSEWLGLSG